MVNLTWSTTTSVKSVKIILPPPMPLGLIKHLLPLFSFLAGSIFLGTSTSYDIRLPKILCLRVSLRLSSKRVLETLDCLQILSGIGLDKTISTNKKNYRIGLLTLNICNLFLWNLMLVGFSENSLLFESSKIVSNLQLPLR